jgi:hypothetical protein
MKLTDSELEILRQRPNQTTLNLFVFQPKPVLKCLINSPSIAKGAMSVPYDSVSFGSYYSVETGMTLLVGSAEGLSDIGRLRIKSITSNTIVTSEDSNIRWADNLYLTVLRYFEVWPVFPRIIRNPNKV